MNIGVFDSGAGGKSVADALVEGFPQHTIIYAQDSKNVPYGTKSPEVLVELVIPILKDLVSNKNVDIIVIACNTVTTTIIKQIRDKITVPIIGIEPMVKPASEMTKSNIIAVCATPTTLKSSRYKQLVDTYAKDITVIEPDCSSWASLIEQKQMDREYIDSQVKAICEKGADVIVLGCTHYHWIEADIKKVADTFNVSVIQPEQAIVRRVKQVIEQLG